jgi:hypothetical protein
MTREYGLLDAADTKGSTAGSEILQCFLEGCFTIMNQTVVQIRCLTAQDNFKDGEKIKFKLGLNLQQGWKLPDSSVGDISGVSL